MHLHCYTDDAIRRVPEAHVSGVRAALGRPPRHGNDKHLDEKPKYDPHIPGFELGVRAADAFETVSDEVDTNGQSDVEEAIRVGFEADDY